MVGQRDSDGVVVVDDQLTVEAFFEKATLVADLFGREFVLLVVIVFHEHKTLALSVEILGGEFVDVGDFEALARAVGLVGDGAADEVFQFTLVEGGPFARLAEIHFDDLKWRAVDLDFEALAKFVGTVASHWESFCFEGILSVINMISNSSIKRR